MKSDSVVIGEPLHADGKGTGQAQLDVVNAAELTALVSMPDAIELIAGAMIRLSSGSVDSPERWVETVSDYGLIGLMPGAFKGSVFGIKVLSLFDPASRQGLPGHQGMMLLFDGADGRPLSVIEASALTGLRTAAASAVATRALAGPDATSMALIGCGEQARWHALALPLVRPIDTVWIWNRHTGRAVDFAKRHLGHIPTIRIAGSPEEAVQNADIISTLTHAEQPILQGTWLRAGQHLNLVGSSTAGTREVDDDVVVRSRFIVDSRPHVLSQGGEFLRAMESGAVTPDHIAGEIGEVLAGKIVGRKTPDQITVYKSLGHVVQDLEIAREVHDRLKGKPGTCQVDW